MAAAGDHGHGSDAGSMDISEHVRTWKGFVSFIKWQVVGIVIIMVLLAMFRTHG
jgi:hypothetical protein